MGTSLPAAAPSLWEEYEAGHPAALESFERLVGKGHPPRRAAARLGATAPAIRALSATVQQQHAR